MLRGSRVLGLVMTMAVLMLSACRARDLVVNRARDLVVRDEIVDLKDILPDTLQAVHVQRLTPGDSAEQEWLVLYRYDLTDRFSPIAGVVYRAGRGGINQPPIIFPYPLRLPDRDYLGAGAVLVRQADVIKVWPGQELVVENRNADGVVTEASIFRWHDSHPTETWRDPEDERYYECMGFFRTDGGVEVREDEVVVKRLVGDRSQLARYFNYRPDERGSYLNVDGQPRSVWIDFAFGQSGQVLDSPYPEKIVLAFYKALGNPTADLKSFFSTDGELLLNAGLPGYGCTWPPDQVGGVTILEISYFPEMESQVVDQEVQQALVELKVQCQSKEGKTMQERAHVGWFLRREAGQWKMDQVYQPVK